MFKLGPFSVRAAVVYPRYPLIKAMSQSSFTAGPIETSIRDKLLGLLNPSVLTITNDSHHHSHHKAMRDQGGGNGETHFTIHVVSDAFKGKSMMQRHRMIYGALSTELQEGLHALSLKTKTPEEAT